MTDKQKIENMLRFMCIPRCGYKFEGDRVVIDGASDNSWVIFPKELNPAPRRIYSNGSGSMILEYDKIEENPADVLKEVIEKKGHQIWVEKLDGCYWVNVEHLIPGELVNADGLDEIHQRTGLRIFCIRIDGVGFSKP